MTQTRRTTQEGRAKHDAYDICDAMRINKNFLSFHPVAVADLNYSTGWRDNIACLKVSLVIATLGEQSLWAGSHPYPRKTTTHYLLANLAQRFRIYIPTQHSFIHENFTETYQCKSYFLLYKLLGLGDYAGFVLLSDCWEGDAPANVLCRFGSRQVAYGCLM